MPEKVYDELTGAIWIRERENADRVAVANLLEPCRCLNGDFFSSDEMEHPTSSAWLDYLFAHPTKGGMVSWSCPQGYVAVDFLEDGGLLILWSEDSVTEAEAVCHVGAIFEETRATAGYVGPDLYLPTSSEEFQRLFFSAFTLHRFDKLG